MITKQELERLQSLGCNDILLIKMLLDSHNKQPATAFEKAFKEEVKSPNETIQMFTTEYISPEVQKQAKLDEERFFINGINKFLTSWILIKN
jgi:hypothetical protein